MLYISHHESVLHIPSNAGDIWNLESPDSPTLEWGGAGHLLASCQL